MSTHEAGGGRSKLETLARALTILSIIAFVVFAVLLSLIVSALD